MAALFQARVVQSVLSPIRMQQRFLNLHEYQSKALMQKFNVRVQKFAVADKADEAQQAAIKLRA